MRQIVILAALAALCAGSASGAETSSSNTGSIIRVTGVGEILAVPDMAKFRFTLSHTSLRAEEAAAQARSAGEELAKAIQATPARFRRIAAGLVEPGAEQIRIVTSGVPDTGADNPPLYRARWVVETDLVKLDEAAAVEEAAKRARPDVVIEKEYGLTYPDAFYEEALKRAANAAETKADALVRAMGGTLGSPLEAIEEPALIRQPAAVSGAAPPSSMLRIQMKAVLSVRYEYKPEYIYQRRRPVGNPGARNDAGKEPAAVPAAAGAEDSKVRPAA